MELTLTSYHKDLYPVCGFFVEGSELDGWLIALDKLGLPPSKIEIHGLPTTRANQIWGCLVIVNPSYLPHDLGSFVSAHMIGDDASRDWSVQAI